MRDALHAYKKKYNLTTHALSRKVLIKHQTLKRFMDGTGIFYSRSIKFPLDKLEALLELPKGCLSRAKQYRAVPEKTLASISYRERNAALCRIPYILPDPPPLYPIHEEFLALRHFKTTEILPRGMQRGSRWGLRSVRDSSTKVPAWAVAVDDHQICPTADVVWTCIAGFIGWASLAPERGGKGLDATRLSLVYLADVQLVREYFEFHKARHNGSFSTIFIAFLNNAASLLRKRTGYIRQRPEFGNLLPTPIPLSDWDTWCEKAWRELVEMTSALEQVAQKHRDPKEPIQLILNRQHPLTAIEEMLENMKRASPIQKYKRAAYKRDYLLIKLLSIVPLRVRNVAALTFSKSNTGQLTQTSDTWKIEIKGREFKNYRHAARDDFSITLPVEMYKELDEYIRVWRPLLLEGATGLDRDILFPQQNGKKFPPLHLSMLVSKLTKKYCPDTPGFGPHAFRHIVATEYLKNNPNGYQVVAYILHDKLATVLEEYGHVTTSDGFAHWTKYLQESALMSSEKDKNREK